jgi:hypothetical protein
MRSSICGHQTKTICSAPVKLTACLINWLLEAIHKQWTRQIYRISRMGDSPLEPKLQENQPRIIPDTAHASVKTAHEVQLQEGKKLKNIISGG